MLAVHNHFIYNLKILGQMQWFMPIILPTQKANIASVTVKEVLLACDCHPNHARSISRKTVVLACLGLRWDSISKITKSRWIGFWTQVVLLLLREYKTLSSNSSSTHKNVHTYTRMVISQILSVKKSTFHTLDHLILIIIALWVR
jgi:hypothetical protein